MIVSEFIEWLKTQDQDAEVHISVNIPGGYESYTAFRGFDPEEHSYYYENFKILELGDD